MPRANRQQMSKAIREARMTSGMRAHAQTIWNNEVAELYPGSNLESLFRSITIVLRWNGQDIEETYRLGNISCMISSACGRRSFYMWNDQQCDSGIMITDQDVANLEELIERHSLSIRPGELLYLFVSTFLSATFCIRELFRNVLDGSLRENASDKKLSVIDDISSTMCRHSVIRQANSE